MKKFLIISLILSAAVIIESCGNKKEPGRVYMPDMAYSRALETYSPLDKLHEEGINYNAKPVPGTVKRGDPVRFEMLADTTGSYVLAANDKNPLPPLTPAQMDKTRILFNINCGICHGEKLDGNGPLYKGGNGPFPAAPANFVGNPLYLNMAEGTMFHSMTYGKNKMGSYASQLNPTQRWEIVHYIKAKQAEVSGTTSPADADSTAK